MLKTFLPILLCASASASDVFVSPEGNDGNTGTIDSPLSSLIAARDMARKRLGSEKNVNVLFREGMYQLSDTFELNEKDSNTSYSAYKGEHVSVIGGKKIPNKAVAKVTNPKVLDRIIEKGACSQVLQINLKALGFDDFGKVGPRGFRRSYISAPMELFIDGEVQQLSRWPNNGEKDINLGKVIDRGSLPRGGDYSFRGGVFQYDVARAEQWTQAKELYVAGHLANSYADDVVQVAKIDTEKGTFTLTHPHLYGLKSHSITAWHALNLLEEIDLPGEYFIDRDAGILYFYPPLGFSEKSQIYVSVLDTPMVALENAENVSFTKMTFEITRDSGIYIEGGKNNTIKGCTLRNMGNLAIQFGQGTVPFPYGKHDGCGYKADEKPGVPASRQMGNWHEQIYRFSAWNRKAGTGHTILSCDIYDIGAGGIMLGGGDRKTLTPGNNTVKNCDIYRVNRWDRTYKCAINLDGVGNNIINNHLHNGPGPAVYVHGNDHTIEYNEVDDVVTEMSDMGAFYMGRDPSELGHSFSYNFFYNIKNSHKTGHGVQVIFFDNCSFNAAKIVGNTFVKAGSNMTIKYNGGGNCEISNNIFVDCPHPPVGQTPLTSTKRFHSIIKSKLFKERILENVDISKPPYSTRYPKLFAVYNNKLEVLTEEERNYEVSKDYSQFVDPENMNFALKKDSSVYKEIKGFKVIPFDKIGIYLDAFRTVLPAVNPVVKGKRVFVGNTSVVIDSRPNHKVYYTLDGSVPTKASTAYTAPIKISQDSTLKTIAINKAGVTSEVVSAFFKRKEYDRPTEIKINFQGKGAKVRGTEPDSGDHISVKANGTYYGWNEHTDTGRTRKSKNKNPLQNSLLLFKPHLFWEIAVDNGTYEVTVSAGDPQSNTGKTCINVEGVVFLSNVNLGKGEFKEVTKTVTVTDGKLTMKTAKTTKGMTKINYIFIKKTSGGVTSATGSGDKPKAVKHAVTPGKALKVDITDLLAHPKKYHGKKVHIKGYATATFENTVLWVTKADASNFKYGKAIWISGEMKKSLDKKTVELIGEFRSDDKGHMEMFPGVIKLEHARVYKGR